MIIFIDSNGTENVIRNDQIAIDLFKRGSITSDTMVKTSIRGEWKKAKEIELFSEFVEVKEPQKEETIKEEAVIEENVSNIDEETKTISNEVIDNNDEDNIQYNSSVPSTKSDINEKENIEFSEEKLSEPDINNNSNKETAQQETEPPVYQARHHKKVGFGKAIKICFAKYFDFKGRARRSEYWYFLLFILLTSVVLGFIEGLLQVSMGWFDFEASLLANLFTLFILFPSIAVSVRRLHDIGRTGWWILISFIPIAGSIILLIWHCIDGEKDTNIYGVSPKY
ncbi:DUF805 domain-containing protein [Pelagibacteraceae bacterium]|nr:DUF805 domain-containing protein [Pelagibacteraceae bacterium]MDC3131097.1 DUF805 domain-containing protein [Pelagibacteraceae bacterium]